MFKWKHIESEINYVMNLEEQLSFSFLFGKPGLEIALRTAVFAVLVSISAERFAAVKADILVDCLRFFITRIIVVRPPFPAAIRRAKPSDSSSGIFRNAVAAARADQLIMNLPAFLFGHRTHSS